MGFRDYSVLLLSLSTPSNLCLRTTPATSRTVATWFPTGHPAFDHGSRTPYSWLDFQSMKRAILSTGTAFHATVLINYGTFAINNRQNLMRANFNTYPTACAFVLVKF